MESLIFPAEPLERLSKLILGGDVVFFVGSGASIDSEGNSAARLMIRLLVRMLAFTDALDQRLGDEGTPIRRDFKHTFGLEGSKSAEIVGCIRAAATIDNLFTNIKNLSTRYYEANEWFCRAFTCLLVETQKCGDSLLRQVEELERGLCDSIKEARDARRKSGVAYPQGLGRFLDSCVDPVPLGPIDSRLVSLSRSGEAGRVAAGKALFLDTMGFREEAVMGGRPQDTVPFRQAERSYHGKLLPRHHILARFAREGFCSSLLTTNFDLLLEGAYRLAGFHGTEDTSFPGTTIRDFKTIASAEDFFTEGKAFREAIVVKMHGCARRYRDVYDSDSALEKYLPALVFTYREIQNWRTDSWAADYLRTLLRTRVVVFCGYSVQDPVIHDTFRTVYEEMARVRTPLATTADTATARAPATAEHAPAFFFAPHSGGAREFHGMAVLQAATAAIGAQLPPPGKHPNYLPFQYRNTPTFPNFDELMRWLFHLTFRARQQECLRNDLRRIATLLLGGPCAQSELVSAQRAFDALCAGERRAAQQWKDRAEDRTEHAGICARTDLFHVGLLREFACGDIVRQRQGAGVDLGRMRRQAWYYPAMQDASWTCWGAIVELALHRMAEAAEAEISVGDCRRPTVFVRLRGGRNTPHSITIQFGGFERIGINARMLGHPWRRVFWELGPGDAPWRAFNPKDAAKPVSRRVRGDTAGSGDERKHIAPRQIVRAPDAALIWRWASGIPTEDDRATVKQTLGFP